jgi:dihydropyrimidine dehydrogenase (NAD+) subunit PreT
VFSALGQLLTPASFGGESALTGKDGRILVDEQRRTSAPGVWAGGDCIYGGQDLTVSAVEDGKQAARSIDAALQAGAKS